MHLARLACRFDASIFMAISAMTATEPNNPIAKSLRKAEIALERYFESEDTDLVIARICDIYENKGSLASLIERQIRGRMPICLPPIDSEVRIISKESAVDFLLGALVDKATHSEDRILFSYDQGEAIRTMEVVNRLVMLYGKKYGEVIPKVKVREVYN
jgi:FlaA1/EpsC-like NDP-sugar epimerase